MIVSLFDSLRLLQPILDVGGPIEQWCCCRVECCAGLRLEMVNHEEDGMR